MGDTPLGSCVLSGLPAQDNHDGSHGHNRTAANAAASPDRSRSPCFDSARFCREKRDVAHDLAAAAAAEAAVDVAAAVPTAAGAGGGALTEDELFSIILDALNSVESHSDRSDSLGVTTSWLRLTRTVLLFGQVEPPWDANPQELWSNNLCRAGCHEYDIPSDFTAVLAGSRLGLNTFDWIYPTDGRDPLFLERDIYIREGADILFAHEGVARLFAEWLGGDPPNEGVGNHLQEAQLGNFAWLLYDAVQKWPPGRYYSAYTETEPFNILKEWDYGGLEQCQGELDQLKNARLNLRHTNAAISRGRRKHDLLKPLVFDHRLWVLCRPDLWPSFPENQRSTQLRPSTAKSSALPTALWLLEDSDLQAIFACLDLDTLTTTVPLALCSTQQTADRIIPLIDRALQLRAEDPDGDLRWILPVRSPVLGEIPLAQDAAMTWFEAPSDTESKEGGLIMLRRGFPMLRFYRGAMGSLSMRNRLRLWKGFQRLEPMLR
ncbi:hypothetical protein DFJ73DRAFT_755483 [Zopfochytrium polystomum]|nr:hypothetical protein DFJ73DRAFT_755483 [Zopfochytrium polystomum]